MKHILLFFLIVGFGILTHAQTQYEVYNDGHEKILKGKISKDLIAQDPAFGWYQENQAGYIPRQESVKALKAKKGIVELLIFGGTWNRETRYFLPKFFKMAEAASFPEDRILIVGLDPNKKSMDHLSEEMHITSVPTYIILRDGREVGRVTVSREADNWENKFCGILNSLQ
jgi:hypothetical protein